MFEEVRRIHDRTPEVDEDEKIYMIYNILKKKCYSGAAESTLVSRNNDIVGFASFDYNIPPDWEIASVIGPVRGRITAESIALQMVTGVRGRTAKARRAATSNLDPRRGIQNYESRLKKK